MVAAVNQWSEGHRRKEVEFGVVSGFGEAEDNKLAEHHANLWQHLVLLCTAYGTDET